MSRSGGVYKAEDCIREVPPSAFREGHAQAPPALRIQSSALYDQGVAVKMPRFRIAWIMVAVAIVAIDFGAIREMFRFDSEIVELLVVGVLPMANVLAVGLLVGQRRPGKRPFLPGFEAFGAVASTIYFALASCLYDEAVPPYLELFLAPVRKIVGQDRPVVVYLTLFSVVVVALGLPQLASALIGGFLSRKYRITITKRTAQLRADR